jgi:hypothetical protein
VSITAEEIMAQVRANGNVVALHPPARKLVLTCAADIEPEPVRWVYTDGDAGRIPGGALGLAAGREGTGKSSYAVWLVTCPSGKQFTVTAARAVTGHGRYCSKRCQRLYARDRGADRRNVPRGLLFPTLVTGTGTSTTPAHAPRRYWPDAGTSCAGNESVAGTSCACGALRWHSVRVSRESSGNRNGR